MMWPSPVANTSSTSMGAEAGAAAADDLLAAVTDRPASQ
jgi:hypothetical protein